MAAKQIAYSMIHEASVALDVISALCREYSLPVDCSVSPAKISVLISIVEEKINGALDLMTSTETELLED